MSQDIVVRVVERVAVAQTKIEVLEIGRQGPPGPSGNAGYTHTQAIGSTQWVINHNLGFRPVVELFDEGGNAIVANVSHPSVNQAIVQFNTIVAGSARLN